METMDEWCAENEISVNKKKSGVLVIQNQSKHRTEINGYPIKNRYRYLGMIVDRTLNPEGTIAASNEKLYAYIKRNEWLMKKYFTPKSLVQIGQYFQNSRIVYGLNIFLDKFSVINKAQCAAQKYLKSTLGLKNNVSSGRIRMTLGIPKLEHQLVVRLHKNLTKYENHFGEFPSLYSPLVEHYNDWLGIKEFRDINFLRENSNTYKYVVLKKSLDDLAAEYKVILGSRFKYQLDKILYKYPHKGDFHMIKYLCNWGFFEKRLFPKCDLCESKDNSRTHVTNECKFFEDKRIVSLRKIGQLIGIPNLEQTTQLEEWILGIYFNPGLGWRDATMRKLIEILRSFASELYTGRTSKLQEIKASKESGSRTG